MISLQGAPVTSRVKTVCARETSIKEDSHWRRTGLGKVWEERQGGHGEEGL